MEGNTPITTIELVREIAVAKKGQASATCARKDNMFIGYENWVNVKLGRFEKRVSDEFTKNILGWSNYLTNFGLKLTGNWDTTQDLLQETFIKAFKSEDRFVGDNNSLKSWLSVIMKYTFLDQERKKKTVLIDIESVNYKITGVDEYDVEADAAKESELATLQLAIKSLKPLPKKVMGLRAKGYAYAEIAKEVGELENNIKTIVFRAKEKIKKYFENQ